MDVHLDKERLKDIIGRPRWWLLVAPAVVAFIVIATLVFPDDADSAPPPAAAEGASRICPSGEWECYTKKRFAREFRDRKYRSARGVALPPRVKKMIRKKAAAQGWSAGDDAAWWEEALGVTTCIAGLRFRGSCRKGQERVDKIMKRTTRVTVFCGGAAVIGAMGGGGAWGAGKGGLACFWARLMGLWK